MKNRITTEWASVAAIAACALATGITENNLVYVLWGIIAVSCSIRCIAALRQAERAERGEEFYKTLCERRSDELIELSIEIDKMNKAREKNQNESKSTETGNNS